MGIHSSSSEALLTTRVTFEQRTKAVQVVKHCLREKRGERGKSKQNSLTDVCLFSNADVIETERIKVEFSSEGENKSSFGGS